MANRLLVDVKEMSTGEIGGRISFPADSPFVLEALALVLEQFSKACGVPISEIVADMQKIAERQ